MAEFKKKKSLIIDNWGVMEGAAKRGKMDRVERKR